jgi:hypothetical protein
MPRAGRLIQSNQRYVEPARVAHTADGLHFVPTYSYGEQGRLDVPAALRAYTANVSEPVLSWVSYFVLTS